MRGAALEEFLAAPIGRWTHVAPLTAWMASPSLCGLAYSGFISSTDVPRLRELATLPFHKALARPYRAILDGTALTGLDPAAFAFLVEHSREIAGTTGLIDRVAYVRPSGLPGAAAVGVFYDHLAPAIAMRFVDTLAEAIAYLEADAHREEIEAVALAAADSTLVVEMRRLLVEDPRRTLDGVARQLKVSTRSLQRACLAAETTFRDEVAAARFAFSEQLLRATDDKIEVIARRAGYASAAAFGRRFVQVHGMTPTQFRAKR